jgi:hypothetical protein
MSLVYHMDPSLTLRVRVSILTRSVSEGEGVGADIMTFKHFIGLGIFWIWVIGVRARIPVVS